MVHLPYLFLVKCRHIYHTFRKKIIFVWALLSEQQVGGAPTSYFRELEGRFHAMNFMYTVNCSKLCFIEHTCCEFVKRGCQAYQHLPVGVPN